MFEKLGYFLLKRRVPVLVVMGLLTVGALILAPSISFNFSPQAIFKTDGGLMEAAEAFKDTFEHNDTLFMAVLEAPEGSDVLSREALAWQFETARAMAGLEGVDRVDAITTVGIPRERPGEPGTLETSPLLKSAEVSEKDESRVRAALKDAPLVVGQIVSKDLRLGALAVSIDPTRKEIQPLTEAVDNIKGYLSEHPPPEGHRIFFSGVPAMRTEVVATLRHEQITLFPMTGFIFLLVLAFLFRKTSGVIPPMLAVGMAVAWMAGMMVILGQGINIINNILPTLIFVIGIADCIHIVSRYAEEARRGPGDRGEAVVRTIRHLAMACLLTASTTAVGFLSLIVARTEILRSFGMQAAMGCLFVYITSIFVLGSILPTMQPPDRAVVEAGEKPGVIERIIDRVARFVVLRPALTLVLSLSVVATALVFAAGVKVDSYLMEAYDEGHPNRTNMQTVEQAFGGFLPIEISLETKDKQGFLDPALFAKISKLQDFAGEQEGVLSTQSYVDFHQEMRVAVLGDPAQRAVMPPVSDLGRRQLFQIQELIDSGSRELGFARYMSLDKDHARIRLRIADIGSLATIDLAERLTERLAADFPEGSPVKWQVVGEAYVASSGIDSFIRDLFYSLLAAVLVIFVMMGAVFRSIRVGLLSMLPNLAPLLMTVGYIGLRGYDMNTTNVIVFAIGLGLAVNDTIHFLTRFQEEVTRDGDVGEAIRRTFMGAGRAIVLTTIMLLMGMMVIYSSDFLPSRRFAELVGLTVASALLGDLLILPACLKLFWKVKPEAADGQS